MENARDRITNVAGSSLATKHTALALINAMLHGRERFTEEQLSEVIRIGWKGALLLESLREQHEAELERSV